MATRPRSLAASVGVFLPILLLVVSPIGMASAAADEGVQLGLNEGASAVTLSGPDGIELAAIETNDWTVEARSYWSMASSNTGSNLLDNPGCEGGDTADAPIGWTRVAHGPIECWDPRIDGGPAPVEGAEAFIDAASDGLDASIEQTVAVNGSTKYNISGWVGSFSTNDYARIEVEYLDGTGTVLPDGQISHDAHPGPNGDWAQFNASSVAPSEAETAVVRIVLVNDDGQNYADSIVDALEFRQVATAPTISNFTATNPSSQDVEVSLESDKQLSTIQVSLSGPESATLTTGDFTESGSGPYTYTATYAGSSDGTYTATLDTAEGTDGVDGASGESDSVAVETTADLSTTLTSAPSGAPYHAGETVEYTFEVTNAGPSDDGNVTLEPSGLTTGEAGLKSLQWDTDNDAAFDDDTGNSTTVTLASGESQTVSLRATVGDDATGNVDHDITASTSSGLTDPDSSNNNASVSVVLNTPPSFTASESLANIDEDVNSSANGGARIDSTELFGDEFSDADGDSLGGIVVTDDAATAGEGSWQYSTDGGTNWHDADDGSLSSSNGLLLSSTASLRFVPAPDYSGDPGNLTVFAVDDSGSTTYTSGSTRQTYDTTVDGKSSVAAASSNTVSITVDPVNDPPTADAGSNQTVDEDVQVNFDGTGSNDTDGSISTYEWDFGDGRTASGDTVTHTYFDPGTYTVTLTVEDDGGNQDTDTVTITVEGVDDWPTFGGDASLRGNNSDTEGLTIPEVRWQFDTRGTTLAQSAVVNGTVYVGSSDNTVYALDADTGAKRWSYTAGNAVKSSPAVVDGTVYVGSDDNTVYALDADTGAEQWTYATGDDVRSSPTVVNGTVYVGSTDNTVYALDADTGAKRWTYVTGKSVYSSPAVVDGTVYVGSDDNTVYALDADTGAERWTYAAGDGVRSSPTVVNGTVYFGSGDGNVYALDADTGVKRWTYATGLAIFSTPTVMGDTVYVGSYDKNVYALDADTGAERWTYITGDWVNSAPIAVNDTIYVGSNDNTVYALDADTGAKRWEFATDGDLKTPTVVNGSLYVGTSRGSVYALQSDETAPTISNFTVTNPSGQSVTVSFESDEQLATLEVSISGPESATLTEANFTESGDGPYYYSATYAASTDGGYTATLGTAEDEAGNDGANGQQGSVIVDTTPPVADAGDNQTVDEDTVVSFNGSDSSDNIGLVSYEWDFGDGNTSTGETGNHTYTDPGVYTVTLTVTDDAGNQGSDTVTITVNDVTSPIADAGENQAVDEDTEVSFDGSNSSDNDGIASYAWDFGDGNTTTGQNVTHTYADPGTYTVTLTVEDSAGNRDSDAITSTIADTTAPTPDAGGNRTVDEDITVTFDASNSSDNVDVTSYVWDFGDGENATGESTSHVYSDPGTYTVTLTVSDAAGNEAMGVIVVTVSDTTAPVVSNFSVKNSHGQNVDVSLTSDERLADLEATVSGVESATLSFGAFAEIDNGDGTYTYVATHAGSTDGSYAVALAHANDSAGNDGAAGEAGTVTVDTTPPTVTGVAASNPSGQNVTVSFSTDERLNAIQIGIEGAEWATLTMASATEVDNGDGTYTYTVTHAGSSNGTYTATLFSATDAAGNDGAAGDSSSVPVGYAVISSSVEFVSGAQPDMANVSLDAFFAGSMLQVQMKNDTANESDFSTEADYELAGLGADNTTVLQIDLTVNEYVPRALIGSAHDVTWTRTNNGDGTWNVSITATPAAVESYFAADGSSPTTWPGTLKANESQDAALTFAVDSLGVMPDQHRERLNGSIMATDAQEFGSPRYNTSGATDKVELHVKGPHFATDGTDNTGFFEAYLPQALLDAWGVSATQLAGELNGASRETNVTAVPGGGARVEFDVHYSEVDAAVTVDSTAPTADAGPNQTVDEDTVLGLDGTNSTDNVGITNYEWDFGDGSANVNGAKPSHTFDDPGTYTVTLNVTDAAGNSDADTLTVTVNDTTPPPAPSTPDLVAASDSGTSQTDDLTNETTPTLTGTAEANAVVTISSNEDGTLGTTTADADGDWSFAPGAGLSTGAHDLTATATDAAGNTGPVSGGLSVTIDTTAPVPPTAPDLSAANDTGESDADDVTNETAPTLTGTAEPNSVVEIVSDLDGALGTTTADGNGDWSFAPGAALSEGAHVLTATATDTAGNSGSDSAGLSVTVDTTQPAAPSAPDLDPASDAGRSSTDDVTNETKPTMTGTAEANAIVAVTSNRDGSLGTTTADGTGSWSFTPSSALSEATHEFTVTATDSAGNVGPASTGLTVTVDTAAPAAPSILDLAAGSDTGTSDTDDETNVTTPMLTGTAEAGSTVTIASDQDGSLGTTTADGNGDWSFTPGSVISEATHGLTATATDTAGNTGPASTALSVTIDATAPNAPPSPDLATTDDTGISDSDDVTNETTPALTGTAEANAIVTVSSDRDGTLGTTTADASGNWLFTPGAALSEGTHAFTVTATDAAGNAGPPSTGLTVTVDDSAPAAPSTPDLLTANDTGGSSTDDVTNETTPTLTGTTEVNAVVTVASDLDGTLGTTTADAGGNWSFTPGAALSEGAHTITITATDAAGNTGPASTALSVTVDASAPSAPSTPDLTAASDSGSAPTDDVTNSTTPTVTGTAEANAVVTVVSDQDGTLGTATADGNGDWSFTPGSALSETTHSLTATATDAAGNTGPASGGLTVTIDATAPSSPSTPDLTAGSDTGSSSTDDVTNDATPAVTGTAEANAIITVTSDQDGTLGTATADGNGDWSFTPGSALSDGVHSLMTTATDTAGNTGHGSAGLSVTVDTAAPTAPSTPDLSAASDSGDSSTDDLTNETTPTLAGTAEANAMVTIVSDQDGSLGTTTADGNGNWSFSPSSAFTEATYSLTATATDAAGNTGPASTGLSVTVDTSAPNAPSTPDLAASSDTGRSSTDDATNDTTPTLSGTGEADATITVASNRDGTLGPTMVDGTGNWSFTPSSALSEGSHAFNATGTDSAGNVGRASTSLTATIDTSAPAVPPVPDLAAADDTGRLTTDNVTKETIPTLTGTTEADAVVAISSDQDGTLGTTTADGNGDWSFTPGSALSEATHALAVTATDVAGNTAPASPGLNVTVDVSTPNADAGDDQPVDEDTQVSFDGTNSTDNVGVVSYEWDFDDGSANATGATANHTYSEPGAYTVILNVTDDAGNADLDTLVVTVTDTTAPTADAGTNRSVDEDVKVRFDGSDSVDNVGIASYEWDFGDGLVISAGNTVNHTYTDPGTYTVTLTVTDSAGNVDTDSVLVSVVDVTDPNAAAGDDQTIDEDTAVIFNGGNSGDNVGIVSYEWDFDDDTTSVGRSASHTYTVPGTYSVTLTVTDGAGNTDTDTVVVTVIATGDGQDGGEDDSNVSEPDPLSAEISVGSADPFVGDPISFAATATGGTTPIESYEWHFGGERSAVGEAATHEYTEPGNYTVTLTITDGAGATASATTAVTVEGLEVELERNRNDGNASDDEDDGDDEGANVTIRVRNAKTGSTVDVAGETGSDLATASNVSLANLAVSVTEATDFDLETRVEDVFVDDPSFETQTDREPIGRITVDHETSDETFDLVTFTFRVRTSYLDAAGMDADSVRLYRQHDGEWNELETSVIAEIDEYHVFEAISPGLSVFVVGGPATTPTDSGETGTTVSNSDGTGSTVRTSGETERTVQDSGEPDEEPGALLPLTSLLLAAALIIAVALWRRRAGVNPPRNE